MARSVLHDMELICVGRLPSCSDVLDKRFVVPGDKNFPSVRVFLGFQSRRSIRIGEDLFWTAVCSVRESTTGPLYTCKADVDAQVDGKARSIQTVGSTMTRAVQELLGQLRNEVLGEDMYGDCKRRAESSVKGPHFWPADRENHAGEIWT